MAIHFITGKPGGGKTLYAVNLIVYELLHGSRHIITNVPLRLDVLNEYIQKQTDKDCSVVQRVHLLYDEDAAEFFCVRPHVRLKAVNKDEWDRGERPSYSQAASDGGVLYVIDEVQNFFSARRWAKTGPHVLYYQSQHRKLGDTVILITQAAQLVETQFRAIAEDFCEIKNWSKMRISYLTMPRLFLRQLRSSCSPGAFVLETKFKRLDMKMAECYDTAAGVNIHGRTADKGEKAKGVPWWVALTALAILGFFGSRLAARAFVSQFTIPRVQPAFKSGSPPSSPAPAAAPSVPAERSGVGFAVNSPVVTNKLHITGQFGTRLCLSDGRVVSLASIPVWGMAGPERWWYLIDGQKLLWP